VDPIGVSRGVVAESGRKGIAEEQDACLASYSATARTGVPVV